MNVLIVTWDAGGNVPPVLGLGGELLRRGHRVRCIGPQGVGTAVARVGMAFLPLEFGAAFDPLAPLPPEQSQQMQGAVFFGDGYMVDLRREVEREQPDVIVIDCFLVAAQAAVEAMGLPFVLLVHTLPGWFMPFWDEVLLGPTNAMRQQAGLSPIVSTAELWTRAVRTLVVSPPLLDSPTSATGMLPGLRYVGPIFEPWDPEELAVAAVPEAAEPIVLVTTSTTFMDQEQSLARVINALATLDVRTLVTVGPAVDAAGLPNAANVSIHRWLPHAAVLPHTRLVITHGGHSTVVKALSFGVPLLCLPLGRDQGFIARRIEDIGAGRTLSPDAMSDTLASATTSLLREGTYRRAAQRIANAIREAGPGERNAAAEIEAICCQ